MNNGLTIKKDITILYGSTKKFSEESGISRTTIYDLYNKGIEKASPATLSALSKYLGYDFEKLKEGVIATDPVLLENYNKEPTNPNNILEDDLLSHFRKLSIKGQLRVIEYIEDILPKYSSEV